MAQDNVRPVQGDTQGWRVGERLVALEGKQWFAADAGEQLSYAVEARNKATGAWDVLIAVEWPGRVMGTDEYSTLRILLAPADAAELAANLAHTARWAAEHAKLMDSRGSGKRRLR